MPLVDQHVYAILRASQAAANIMEILPGVDLIEEAKNILILQNEILMCFINGKHFGTDNLNTLIEYSEQVIEEITRIKDEK